MHNNYLNYHKHTHVSSIFSPDSNEHAEGYIKKSVEYGMKSYFTTEHGTMGDIFEAKTLCDQYDLHCKAGMEGYIVPDATEKDKSNYHIIIIPRTNKARRKLNLLSSRASIDGYYYRPRFSTAWVLELDPQDVYITTACVAGILRDETSITDIFLPLVQHFGSNVFLEVQSHNVDIQKEVNKKALALRDELNLRLIAACDSHYVDPSGKYERLELLKGKGITYGDEDDFVLDFPDPDTLYQRFQNQGILSDELIAEAFESTMILEECEDIDLDHSIKMPNIYPDLTPSERMDMLEKEVWKRFETIKSDEGIEGDELKHYEDGIKYELQTIRDTNEEIHTADYFLFNEKNVDLAVNKYGGVLTRGGRGSAASFYVNRILGMTQLDRFKINLPIFPERFMSTARLLENRALPDIDFNCKSQEPFVKASRELLGEHGCYPMIAYGTMQLSEAFRNVCRSKQLDYETVNEVGKNIEKYIDDPKWKPIIEEANRYVDTIISASVHPCAHLLSDKNILEEYGIVRVGDHLCVMVTSSEADEYKLLKNDYLVVKVWKLIDETFKLVGIPIPTAKEVLDSIKDDPRIWKLIKDGINTTLNQIDSDNGSRQAREYGIQSFEEGAFIAAAIRPSFNSWREQFLSKKPYSTGSKDLDEVLKMTGAYILFQENLMQYFEWLGVTPAESIGLIKKISKKKIKQEDFDNLEERLKKNWIEKTGSEDMFKETWELVQSCISYGFCSAHAAATSLDMCYGAYCKIHYPYEYYTVCFNNYQTDEERTNKLREELKYFKIKLVGAKFGHSRGSYSFDKENHTIYKGVESIKGLNAQVAEEMYELRNNHYRYFTDLLYDLKDKTTLRSNQLDVLIKLNFFSDFGDPNKLLYVAERFNSLATIKTLKRDKAEKLMVEEDVIRQFADKETPTRIEEIDCERYIEDNMLKREDLGGCQKRNGDWSTKKLATKLGFDLQSPDMLPYATKIVIGGWSEIHNRDLIVYYEEHCMAPPASVTTRMAWEKEYLGYIEYSNPDLDKRLIYVMNLNTKYSPRFDAYCLKTGETVMMKVKKRKWKEKEVKVSYADLPFKNGDILYMRKCKQEFARKMNDDGEWGVDTSKKDWWLYDYGIVEPEFILNHETKTAVI